MTLRINRISTNDTDVAGLSVRVQEFADLVTGFKICRRVQVPVENVTTLTPILLKNSYGFQVGGVTIILLATSSARCFCSSSRTENIIC